MYVIFRTEHGETIIVNYTVAYCEKDELYMRIEEIDVENGQGENARITVNHISNEKTVEEEGWFVYDINTELGVCIDILEMVPDMREHLTYHNHTQTRYKKQREINCEIDREAQTITYRGNKIHALLEGDWYEFDSTGSLHFSDGELMVDDVVIYVSENDKRKDWYKDLLSHEDIAHNQ